MHRRAVARRHRRSITVSHRVKFFLRGVCAGADPTRILPTHSALRLRILHMSDLHTCPYATRQVLPWSVSLYDPASPPFEDADALVSDWDAVAGDLQMAILAYEEEQRRAAQVARKEKATAPGPLKLQAETS